MNTNEANIKLSNLREKTYPHYTRIKANFRITVCSLLKYINANQQRYASTPHAVYVLQTPLFSEATQAEYCQHCFSIHVKNFLFRPRLKGEGNVIWATKSWDVPLLPGINVIEQIYHGPWLHMYHWLLEILTYGIGWNQSISFRQLEQKN